MIRTLLKVENTKKIRKIRKNVSLSKTAWSHMWRIYVIDRSIDRQIDQSIDRQIDR